MKTSWIQAGANLVKFAVVASLSLSGHLAPAFSNGSYGEAWPQVASDDPFHLTGQSWELGTANSKLNKLYDMFGIVRDAADVSYQREKPPAFDKFIVEEADGHLVVREAELKPDAGDDETNDASHLRTKEGGASHHFNSIKPLRWSVDRDLLVVVDVAGVVHAIDMHLLRGVAYRAPVPVFKLTQVPNVGELGADLEARFVSADDWRELHLKPNANALYPLDRPADHRWRAGDFALLRSTPEKSEVLVELDRTVMLNQISAYETILAYWSDLINPRAKNSTAPEVNSEIPPAAALVLRHLDKDTLNRLGPHARIWAAAAMAPRDEFKMEGEHAFELPTRENVVTRITPNAMLAVGAAIAGGTLLAAGMEHFGFDKSFAHAVHESFDSLKFLVPPVLTDTVYRHTLMKSAFWLSLAAPLMWATAALYGRLTGRNESAKITWVRMGIRTFAKVNQPFWRPMAWLLGQPHIIKAFSLGIGNVTETVSPLTKLGQAAGLTVPASLGWINPLKSRAERRADGEQTKRLLKAYEDRQKDRIALARWLALIAVANESKIDPASLGAEEDDEAAQRRGQRLAADLNQRRRELAMRLAKELARRDVNPNELDRADFAREVERARVAARRLAQRELPEKYLDRAQYEWDRLKTGTLRGLYDFARAQNDFWETVEPSKSISERGWGIFVSDYYFGLPYTMLFGMRADLSHPQDLVAMEGVFANTSPGGRYDIMDVPRWYAFNHNAKITAVFMDTKFSPDQAHAPRAAKTHQPQYRAQPALEAFVEFAKDFVNPSSGEYAETLFEQLKVAFAMIQTSFVLTTGARVVFAGSSLSTSSLSFVYHFVWGHIGVGLIFDFIHKSIERMEKRIARNVERTQGAINAIEAGVRLDDRDAITYGVTTLFNLYKERPRKRTETIRKELEAAVKTGPGVMELQEINKLMMDALANPPLPGKVSKWVKGSAYMLGVGVSTYLGIRMSVPTFAPDVNWGYLIGSSLAYVAVIYPSVYVLNKLWRNHQKKKNATACELDLAPVIPVDPTRPAAAA